LSGGTQAILDAAKQILHITSRVRVLINKILFQINEYTLVTAFKVQA